jgi:DNA uptake protein ComE-like DNA-binding protein
MILQRIIHPINNRIMSNKNADFWYFSRRERNATITLLLAVIVLFLLPAAYRFLPDEPTEAELEAFHAAITSFEASNSRNDAPEPIAALFHFDPNTAGEEDLLRLGLPASTVSTIIKYRNKVGRFEKADDLASIYNLDSADLNRIKPYIRIRATANAVSAIKPAANQSFSPSYFDPNSATTEELLAMGLPRKVVGNIRKYREKGGQFRQKEDFQKIYGLTTADFERLRPYLQIGSTADEASPEKPVAASRQAKEYDEAISNRTETISIDINQAGPEEWQALYGIGPVLSGRIVKFRDLLGGFHNIEQVAETYGLADSTFQSIRSKLQLSPIYKPLLINKLSQDELGSHPYVNWQQARVIVAYRQEHGPFREPADLKAVLALDEAFIARITPYLSFDY